MILPTLRQLRYLVELVDSRHFGNAAQKCRVTQSTLSAGIQELEDLLGVRLLERTKRKVVATPIGLEIAKRARRTLEEAEGLVEAAKADAKPLTGNLRLGIIPTIGPFLLPAVLPGLRSAFPDLKLFLREEQTHNLLEELSTGELDALILALPMETPNCQRFVLGNDPFWLVCPNEHALAKSKAIEPDDIPTDQLLLLEDGHCLREHALTACKLRSDKEGGGFKGTSLHTLVEMVAGGLGVTLIPEMAVASHLIASADLAVRPLSGEASPREIALVWRRTSGRHAEFMLLGERLKNLMAAKRQ